MNQGINLASRPVRIGAFPRALGATALLLALLATGIHFAWWFRARSDVIRTQEDVARMENRLDFLVQSSRKSQRVLEGAPASDGVQWLIAVERSGATKAVHPTEVLGVVADALPRDARILTLRLEPTPPEATMIIEALAGDPPSAADLVTGLSESSSVLETEILEERHQSSGDILLRISASLRPRGTN